MASVAGGTNGGSERELQYVFHGESEKHYSSFFTNVRHNRVCPGLLLLGDFGFDLGVIASETKVDQRVVKRFGNESEVVLSVEQFSMLSCEYNLNTAQAILCSHRLVSVCLANFLPSHALGLVGASSTTNCISKLSGISGS
jgi:hypothetical protein